MTVETNFLDYSAAKLDQLCERIEVCIEKLTPEQVWMRGSDNQNAVGNLAMHLTGNVRQWILSGVGGEPDHRVRDLEFSTRSGVPGAELSAKLRDVVDRACVVFRTLPHSRLTERVVIQGHEVSVLEAIYHVVEHFSGHTGQIIFVTKNVTGQDLGFYSYLGTGAAAGMVP